MSILWGKDKDLDYWSALRNDVVPDAERRAMALLASISDEQRFAFYCMAGMFPAMGNVTKRTYMVRRWTTVLELEDGRPRASWCILAQDRMVAPEMDHVVAMKNILEGNEMAFREVGNAFHFGHDPYRGRVEANTEFMNPYLTPIGPDARSQAPKDPSDWNEDSALQFKELEGWIKTLKLKAELPSRALLAQEKRDAVRSAAAFRPLLLRDALRERAKDWVRIPPKERYKLPPTEFERVTARTIHTLQGMAGTAGGFVNNAGTLTGYTGTNGTLFCTNAATVTPNVYFNIA
jgi:hypothetical protein